MALHGAQNFAAELAADEYNHVAFIRTALGAAAIPIPPVSIRCDRHSPNSSVLPSVNAMDGSASSSPVLRCTWAFMKYHYQLRAPDRAGNAPHCRCIVTTDAHSLIYSSLF